MEELYEAVYGKPAEDRNWTGAIVVQGLHKTPWTEICVREMLERNPEGTLVIISTHSSKDELSEFEREQLDNPSSPHYGRLVMIKCLHPDAERFPDFWRTNKHNQNQQRLTSFMGLHYAHKLGIEVILKIRSEAFLARKSCCSHLKALVDACPVIGDEGLSMKGRIMFNDYGNNLGYFIADMWFFGYTEDLLRYFDMREGCVWDQGRGIGTDFFVESNITMCWAREMKVREGMDFLELLSRYFIDLPTKEHLFFWTSWWPYDQAKNDFEEFLATTMETDGGKVRRQLAWMEAVKKLAC